MTHYNAMTVRSLDGQTRYYLDGVRVRAAKFKAIQADVEAHGHMSAFRTCSVGGALRQYVVWAV